MCHRLRPVQDDCDMSRLRPLEQYLEERRDRKPRGRLRRGRGVRRHQRGAQPHQVRPALAARLQEPGLKIVEQDDNVPYLRAEAQATIPPDGTDDVEFVLRDDGGVRLLYRSATRQAVFLYPLQCAA